MSIKSEACESNYKHIKTFHFNLIQVRFDSIPLPRPTQSNATQTNQFQIDSMSIQANQIQKWITNAIHSKQMQSDVVHC